MFPAISGMVSILSTHPVQGPNALRATDDCYAQAERDDSILQTKTENCFEQALLMYLKPRVHVSGKRLPYQTRYPHSLSRQPNVKTKRRASHTHPFAIPTTVHTYTPNLPRVNFLCVLVTSPSRPRRCSRRRAFPNPVSSISYLNKILRTIFLSR